MLDTPQIVRVEVQLTAVIRLRVPRSEIRQVMGPGMAELMATIAAQGIAPAGPVFSHHFRMDPATFDFEIGVAVARPVVPTGRVERGHIGGCDVARTVYRGPYEGLASAWGEFGAWIAAEALTPAPDLWECYVSGPESSQDSSTWQTELNRPIARQREG